MNIDIIRNLPFNVSFEKIQHYFGIDVSMLFQQHIILAIWFLIMFFCFLPFVIAFAYFDWGNKADISKNLYLIQIHLTIQQFHCFVWYILILATLCMVQFFRRKRRIQDSQKSREPAINDYALLVYNFSPLVQNQDLIQFVQESIEDVIIVDYLRVHRPSQLKLKLKFIRFQQKLYDQLSYNAVSFLQIHSKFYIKLQKYHFLLAILQKCGFYHDAQWYELKLKTLKLQINKKITKKVKETDSIILLFQTVLMREQALKGLNKKMFNDSKLYIKRAYKPSDIIYHNLSKTQIDKWKKQLFTYIMIGIISVLQFLLMAYIREFTTNYQFYQFGFINQTGSLILGFFEMFMGDWILRQFIFFLILFEGHKSYSSQEKSWMTKFYLFSLFNRLSIVYQKDFSSNIEDFTTKYGDFLNIFSKSRFWRFGSGQVGLNLILVLIVYTFVQNLFNATLYGLIKLFLKVIAVSQYDLQQYKLGCTIRYASLYVQTLVVFTLTLTYGFEQPYLLLLAALHQVIQFFSVRFMQLRYSRVPPTYIGMCAHSERIQCFVCIGSVLGIVQYNYTSTNAFYWLALLCFVFLIYMFTNSKTFTKILVKFLPGQMQSLVQMTTKEELSYKIINNPQLQYLAITEQYQLPQPLSETQVQEMRDWVNNVKRTYQNNSKLSRRVQNWSTTDSQMIDLLFETQVDK